MKLDSKTFQGLIETLAQQGDVEFVTIKTAGRTRLQYRLPGERSTAGETTMTNPVASEGETSP